MQNAKLRKPDVVGMGGLIVALFSISRIRYLLDVYYTSPPVGCQVNCLPRRHQGTRDEGGEPRNRTMIRKLVK